MFARYEGNNMVYYFRITEKQKVRTYFIIHVFMFFSDMSQAGCGPRLELVR